LCYLYTNLFFQWTPLDIEDIDQMADYGHVMKPNGDARVPDYVSHELP